MHDDRFFAERILHAGALGYVNKAEAADLIVEAARSVMRGKIFVADDVREQMLSRRFSPGETAQSVFDSLSDRELEVFVMLGQGRATRQIAASLHISVKTVETHRENIKHKLGVSGASELIQRAVQWSMAQKGCAGGEPAPLESEC
jgi:DNA-binding NarL/FixJ family response regulator